MADYIAPDAETVFLVSGGAKGITARCVTALAKRFKARFILVGRSSYDGEEPSWAHGIEGESALKQAAANDLRARGERPAPRTVRSLARAVLSRREIQGTLQAIRRAGGQAVYVQADVTDGPGLREAVERATAALGQITGIVHGAGVIADRLVQDKAVNDFARVVSVKVDGLRQMLALVDLAQLRYLILFSSVAGFYGNRGQTDYAAANEVLNKVAHWMKHHHPHVHVLAIDWGPWDGGMVTPALRRQLERHHVPVIPVESGSRLLTDLLERPEASASGGNTPQVVVGTPIAPSLRPAPQEAVTYRIARRLSLSANPFLADHVIGGRAVLPTVCAVAWMANVSEQLYPGYYVQRVSDYRVLKGIVFDEGLAEEHILELEVKHSDVGLHCDALIRSQGGNGRPRYHYRAQIALRRANQQAEPPIKGLPDLSGTEVIAGRALYEDGTLFHGPSFQGIDSILRMDEEGLTMRCYLPRLPWEMQGQFYAQTFNPFVVDAQLQSLLVWSRHYLGAAGLPLRIAGGTLYRPLHFDEVTYVTMRVRSHSVRNVVADVMVQDEQGAVIMEVDGAEITLSPRLGELFRQNHLAPSMVGGG